MFQDSRFDSLFDGVRKFHAFVGEKLYAIVLIRIVRGGDDDTDVKIVLAHEASDAWSGEDASKRNGSATLNEAGGDDGCNVWAGFAGVRADEGVRRRVVAMEIFGDGKADSEESGVVEGRSSGDAADTICSKKLSRHSVRGRWAPTDKKFSTAAAESRGRVQWIC